MPNESYQIEDGNYTRIINPLIEALVKLPFKGCELAVAFYIIRKTYGFNKREDEIPLSQFVKDLDKSKPVIVKALKNLRLVNVAKLVKQGNTKHNGNVWAINKYINTWELVKLAKLVKHKHTTSKASHKELVKPAIHSKDNIKKQSQKTSLPATPAVQGVQELLSLFYKTINPNIDFKNNTQRKAAEWLIKKYGLEKTLAAANYAISVQNKQYAPTINTPYLLKEKMASLIKFKLTEGEDNKVIWV